MEIREFAQRSLVHECLVTGIGKVSMYWRLPGVEQAVRVCGAAGHWLSCQAMVTSGGMYENNKAGVRMNAILMKEPVFFGQRSTPS